MNMRIKSLFALGMGIICLFALALAGVVIAGEWSRYAQSRAGMLMVDDYGKILVAIDKVAAERSPNLLWIVSSPADEPEKRAALDKAHETSDRALTDLRNTLSASTMPYSARGLAAVNAITEKLRTARTAGQRAVANSDPKARAAEGKAAIGQMLVVTSDFPALLNDLERNITHSDPESLTLADVARLAMDLRDTGGQLSARVGVAVAERRPFSTDETFGIEQTRGQVDALWRQVEQKLASVPPSPALDAAMATTKSGYFGEPMKTMQEVIAVGRRDGQYAITSPQYRKMNVDALSTIAGIRDAALKVAAERSAERSVDARNRLLIALTLIALIIGTVVATTILFSRKLVAPLITLKGVIVEIAGGARDAVIPFVQRKDEIGEIAGALGVLMESARTADQLAAEQQDAVRARAARSEKLDTLARDFEASVARSIDTLSGAAGDMTKTASVMTSAASKAVTQSTTVSKASNQTSQNVSTVASSTEELSASIHEISQQVAQSSNIASRAVEDARRTGTLVRALAERASRSGRWSN